METQKVWELKRTAVQTKAVSAVIDALKETKQALLQMPTGTGKTDVAFAVMRQYIGQKPVLWLTHRTNLKEQASRRGQLYFNGYTVSEFHGKERHFNSNVVVGMVPSLAREGGLKLLKKQLRKDAFSLVVVDEAHHSAAKQFVKVLDLISKKKVPVLGLTATPRRSDGLPLHECFGLDAAFLYSFSEAETDETIARPEVKLTLTNTVINGVPSKNGDYVAVRKLLDRKIVINERNRIIIDKVMKTAAKFWRPYGLKPKTIVYCINVEHARRMEKLFNVQPGIKAALYVGDEKVLSKEDRKRVLFDFANTDKLNMLCCVDLMNEGVDVPSINTLVMCRPTYSNTVYAQQLGRGTRPGKPCVLVFDFFDNYTHAYGARTAANTDAISVKRSAVELDTSYLEAHDFVSVEKRVTQAFVNIDAYQGGRRDFYETKEEAYAACIKHNIIDIPTYRKGYAVDSRLPAIPHSRYPGFSYKELKQTRMSDYKNTLLDMAARKELPPRENNFLGKALKRFTSPKYETFDKKFSKQLDNVFPGWAMGFRQVRSRAKFFAIMPNEISFPAKQPWRGVNAKYVFISKIHGKFKKRATEIFYAWQKGLSGHPKDGRQHANAKLGRRVLNLDTGEVFVSVSDAGKSVKKYRNSIATAISKKTKTGGYRWVYVKDKK